MTPEEIAAKLTPAQRKALLWLPEGTDTMRSARLPGSPYTTTLRCLRGLRLVDRFGWGSWWGATDLGLEVRRIVAAQEGGRDG